jgi:hypothetical protein
MSLDLGDGFSLVLGRVTLQTVREESGERL